MALKAVADSARFPGFQKYRMSIMCRRVLSTGDPGVNKPPSLALENLQPCENVCHSCNKNALRDARCCQAHRDLAWPPRQPQPDLSISSRTSFSLNLNITAYVFIFYGMLFFLTIFHSLLCTSFFKYIYICYLLYLKVLTRPHSLCSQGLSSKARGVSGRGSLPRVSICSFKTPA